MNNAGTGIWSEHNNSRSTVVIMYHICLRHDFATLRLLVVRSDIYIQEKINCNFVLQKKSVLISGKLIIMFSIVNQYSKYFIEIIIEAEKLCI